ncbi:hypothetical protein K6R05_19420 (plasmid) [Pantoea alfalfae]|uniref:FAD-binding domain-containing protein n=1 Tax=Pantoea alfalfae TaxID=3074822 RepID=UPI001CA395EF|nr:FAD-binding domain-containing protein [Pantoea alfalfae]QZX97601.1 hypothetical protein K6R05_19420 [Pantoea alfalfae]
MHPGHFPPMPIPTTTSTNPALRIYNSVSQAHARDPATSFLIVWVSENRGVSDTSIFNAMMKPAGFNKLIIYRIKEAT